MTDAALEAWYPYAKDRWSLQDEVFPEIPNYPNAIRIGYGQRVRHEPYIQYRVCTTPLVRRPHLTMELEEYPSTRRIPWSSLLSALRNHTIIFAGDSITRQSVDAFAADVSQLTDLKMQHMNVFSPACNRTYRYPIPCQLMGENRDEVDVEALLITPDVMVYFIWHTTDAQMDRTVRRIQHISRHFASSTVVFNPGILKMTTTGMTRILSWMEAWIQEQQEKGHATTFLWRETTAAHFPTPTGYREHTRHQRCEPLKYPMKMTEEEQLVRKYRAIKFIPFYHITADAWDLHITLNVSDIAKQATSLPTLDCVHYCWTPALWQPVLHALSRALNP